MKIAKGKTYFARSHGGPRRRIDAIRNFEGTVFYTDMATDRKGNCTIEEFEAWMRDKPEHRHRDPYTRVCKHCGHRKPIVDMVQFEAKTKVMLWKCKGKCNAHRS